MLARGRYQRRRNAEQPAPELLAVKPLASLCIHRPNVDSGDAPVMDPGDATRGYPLDFGDTL